MKKDRSGPAFPVGLAAAPDGSVYHSGEVFEGSEGMTLRDYFAGQAIVGLIHKPQFNYNSTAIEAYRIADALLKARD